MPKPLRFSPPSIPVHVWVRGNQRQPVFFDDGDRVRYLSLLIRHCREHRVRILGYCLMTNHVHLVLCPASDGGVSAAMMRLNSEYAQETHWRLARNGHFWQGRFKSSALDDRYFWTVLRYVELNPVRAGMARRPEEWEWSSAGPHVGARPWPVWLEREPWSLCFDGAKWGEQLGNQIDEEERAEIRRAARQNRPLAGEACVKAWEKQYAMQLSAGRRGRPKKFQIDEEQIELWSSG